MESLNCFNNLLDNSDIFPLTLFSLQIIEANLLGRISVIILLISCLGFDFFAFSKSLKISNFGERLILILPPNFQ